MTHNTFNAWDAIKATALWWSPIAAGFIGAFGTHLLTQSREREKWILDSKKEEYRELLSAISQAHIATREEPSGYIAFASDPNKYSSVGRMQNNSVRIFSDRIFITKELPLDDLREAWTDALMEYSNNAKGLIGDPISPSDKLDNEYIRIKDEIVAAANLAVPKTTWQRLQFWKD